MRKILCAILSLVLSASVLSGCSVLGSTSEPAGTVSINATEPQRPLVPSDTQETGGQDILRQLFRGLVGFDQDGRTELVVAEDVAVSDDSQEFTIRIAPGWTFHNGEPVTAQSFADAWNFGADPANAQILQSDFSALEGYAKLTTGTADTLSGVTVENENTLRVQTINPASIELFALPSFSPLPAQALKDPTTFGQHPIGNGPYEFASWDHESKLTLKRYEEYDSSEYGGSHKAMNEGVRFVFYQSDSAAYANARTGNLDILHTVPLADRQFMARDFPDSNVQQGYAAKEEITIPFDLPHFGQNAEGQLRREAISLAIDRQAISTQIRQVENPTPIRDFTMEITAPDSPLTGSDALGYDPPRAHELWEQANEIAPFSGDFALAYNTDGGHEAWVEAVTNQLSKVLGINAYPESYPTYKSFQDAITSGRISTAYRTGNIAHTPQAEDFLDYYVSDSGLNYAGYSNPRFDELMQDASTSHDEEAHKQAMNEAQEELFRAMPAIPLWYGTMYGVWNPKLQDVHFDWRGYPVLEAVTVNA